MVRRLFKLVLLTGVLAAAGTYLAGWWDGRDAIKTGLQVVATTGVDTARAAHETRRALNEGGLTAKIKAKMALDDSVRARTINVTTHGTTVTLSGTVESNAERDRAMALARETDRVTKVIDDLHTR
jgi:hyperosmotically inducible periplasmic protein